jgi:hypothetical protein
VTRTLKKKIKLFVVTLAMSKISIIAKFNQKKKQQNKQKQTNFTNFISLFFVISIVLRLGGCRNICFQFRK